MVLLILPQSKEQVFQTCFVERYYYSQQFLTSLPDVVSIHLNSPPASAFLTCDSPTQLS